MRRFLLVAALTIAVALPLFADPFRGAKVFRPVETDPSSLKPGESGVALLTPALPAQSTRG